MLRSGLVALALPVNKTLSQVNQDTLSIADLASIIASSYQTLSHMRQSLVGGRFDSADFPTRGS